MAKEEVNFKVPKGRASRGIPAPFTRGLVDLDRTSREWKRVLVQDLRVGDTVADVGRLVVIIRTKSMVMATNIIDANFEWSFNEEVLAFVKE